MSMHFLEEQRSVRPMVFTLSSPFLAKRGM